MKINFTMRTFFAVQQDKSFNSSWQQCLSWARQQIKANNTAIQLLTARGGDKYAVVIAEISGDSERMIKSGRVLAVKRLMNGSKT
jgi:hypothetical protein